MHHLPSRYIPCDGSLTASAYFNPRSPQGKRHVGENVDNSIYGFQSTLPAWGATGAKSTEKAKAVISIHAPRMGSDCDFNPTKDKNTISIHAPRMGSDSNATKQDLLTEQFQSTLPAWGATNKEDKRWLLLLISIHAPRMGSDLALGHCAIISLQFQPTFPAGGGSDEGF